MKSFTESDRHAYNFGPKSLVIDAGGYEGSFAETMHAKYGCDIVILEPVREFWLGLMSRFAGRSNVIVLNVGLGGTSGKAKFGIQGCKSGVACAGENGVTDVNLVSPLELLDIVAGDGRQVDLLKLNIEGSEFDVLEAILDQGLECRFNHLQVQPHDVVPNAAARWAGIRNRLLMNFRITSEDPDLGTGWLLMERK